MIEGDIGALARRHGLDERDAERMERLAKALAAERDPPTTIRSPRDVLERHLADSLEGLRVPAVAGAEALVDIGSGAGFPGLPLALALPGARVDLVESQRRKCAVIERLAVAAAIENARALPLRAEELAAGAGAGRYDVVTARAVAPLAVLVEYAAPLLRPGGVLVAWKGEPDPAEAMAGEAAAREAGMRPRGAVSAAPFPGARRTLYVYSKVKGTPDFLPRRPGVAAKRPLGSQPLAEGST